MINGHGDDAYRYTAIRAMSIEPAEALHEE